MPRKKTLTEGSVAAGTAGETETAVVTKSPARRRTAAVAATRTAAPRKTRTRKAVPAAEIAVVENNLVPPDVHPPGDSAESYLSQGVSLHEQIALLAYSYWQQRGCQGGSPEEDWHRAEQEIRQRAMSAESTL